MALLFTPLESTLLEFFIICRSSLLFLLQDVTGDPFGVNAIIEFEENYFRITYHWFVR